MVEILSGATAARSVAQAVPSPSLKAPNADAGSVSASIISDFYLSPVIRFDPESLSVIFELRDSRSGEVTRQFPPERAARALEESASLAKDAANATERTSGTGETSDERAGQVSGGGESEAGAGSDQEVDVLI